MLRPAIFLGFALIVFAAFLTWSDNPPFSETGIERTGGVFALVASAGAAIITAVDRRPRGAIIAVSVASLVLIAAVVELVDIASGPGGPGPGVYLGLAGAVLAAAGSALLAFGLFRKPG